MHSATLLWLLAATASAAPIPIVLIADWDTQGSSFLPAYGTRANQRLSPAAVAALAAEAENQQAAFDNSHYAPPHHLPPSVVLSTPRPIETTYLMKLDVVEPATPIHTESMTVTATATVAPAILVHDSDSKSEVVLVGTAVEAGNQAQLQQTQTEQDSEDQSSSAPGTFPSDVVRMEIHFLRTLRRVDTPCYYARLRREHNDMMVIGLVAVFLLLIVMAEMWACEGKNHEGSFSAGASSTGSIRLEGDMQEMSGKQPLSIQANSFPEPAILDTEAKAETKAETQ